VVTRARFASAVTLGIAILSSSPREAAPSESFPDRFAFVLGDLRPGAGIAVGFDYVHTHFASGSFDLSLASRVSHRLYQRHEMAIAIPHLGHDRLFADVLALYRSYTEVDYFGVGPDSPEEDHSDYHISGPALFTTVGFRPTRGTAVGARAGILETSLGSGRSNDVPSIEDAFEESELPGLVEEPDYWLFGGFAFLDRRNDPEDATRGGYYEVQATAYRARGLNRFDFEELSLEARHFVPFGPRFVLATRARGVFTRAAEGQEIPFFLLPSLGGTTSLHGFENDRFRDRNLFLINVELRYLLTPRIQLAALVDLGEVFPDFDSFRLHRLELSSGVGVRYKAWEKVLVGVSVGASREGVQAAVKGSVRF
jgi:outer membrane protein assembly factor BamA